ncbi:MAG: hypothetical protein ACRD9W_03815 [Terriglobia bacterium]
MSKSDAIQSGTELGDEFVIESVLGAGGFGITYRVRALKTLNDEVVGNQIYVVKELSLPKIQSEPDSHRRQESSNDRFDDRTAWPCPYIRA